MYKHGMGYFERRGKINDEGLINLPFNGCSSKKVRKKHLQASI